MFGKCASRPNASGIGRSGGTWGRCVYRTVVGPAKAGVFKEEAKESEENEEKRVGSWQLKIK